MPMNSQQVRVVDPVLTNIARGYSDPRFVGSVLFPEVPVNASGGQIITFGKESWRKYNLRRAPGGNVVDVDFGYAGQPYALVQDSVHGKVPREHLRDAAAVPGIDLGTIAVNTAMSVINRAKEIEQAALACDAARYQASQKIDLSLSSWNNPARDPIEDIKKGMQAIADATGFEPNKLVLSSDAWNALSTHPKVLGLFTRGDVENLIITPQMLAARLNLDEIAVGRTTYINESGGSVKAWGQDAVLAYTDMGGLSNALPSYGYTYTLSGNPIVEQAWYDNGSKSWKYPVNNEYSPVIAGSDAGYLFIGAGAPFSG